MKTQIETNYYVEVRPYVNRFVMDKEKRISLEKDACDEIMEGIKRHVDGFDQVSIERDKEQVCSYCGREWTEASDIYNGGCCDEDEANNPEVTP